MTFSSSRPRPVITAASVSALVVSVAGIAGFLGFAKTSSTLSGSAEALGALAIAVLTFGSHLAAALHAQAKVTPVDDPVLGSIPGALVPIVQKVRAIADQLEKDVKPRLNDVERAAQTAFQQLHDSAGDTDTQPDAGSDVSAAPVPRESTVSDGVPAHPPAA